MATRAIQDPLQILGFRDPTTDAVLAGGSVEFYAAGTSNAKEAWEDKDKLTAVTSVTLDSAGQAQLYFDGVYKFIVKNAAGTTRITLDNLKYQARNTLTKTITADYQCTAEDDYILVNTDGGIVTVTLLAVAGVVAPITIKNIGASSLDVTVDGSGAELIDGAATATLVDGVAQQYVTDGIKWYGTVSSGVTYTSSTLVSGTNNTFDAASGITTVNVPDASNTTKGAIEISTDAEAVTGTSEVLAVNPKQLKVSSDAGTSGAQAAKAWVNFNGSGTVAIRDSYNVSSITDNGVGNYDVNFTTPFADTNYTAHGFVRASGGTQTFLYADTAGAKTVSLMEVVSKTAGGTPDDSPEIDVVFFGTQ